MYYMKHFIHRLKRYILHCSQCQLNQTKRHAFYENLRLIIIFALIYHTVIIDFILTFSLLKNELNIIIIVINKFFKKIIFAAGKNI